MEASTLAATSAPASTGAPVLATGQSSNSTPPASRTRRRWLKWKERMTTRTWWHYSYLIDYVLIILLFGLGQWATSIIMPYHHYIPPNDPAVTYPAHAEIIPTWLLMVLSLIPPILAFGIYQFWARSLHDFHHACLGLLESFGFAIFFTGIIKIYTGAPRPNWLAEGNKDTDGRSAFVYRHRTPASNFLQVGSCLHLIRLHDLSDALVVRKVWAVQEERYYIDLAPSHLPGGHVWQQFIVYLPLIGAGLIALSRTRDYHHSFVDVTAGAILGAVVALFNYHLKYPPLWKKRCEIPKRRWYEPKKNPEQWARTYQEAEMVPPV